MKKQMRVLLGTMALCVGFAGCKSAAQIDIHEYSPVAIVSVYGNSTLPWYTPEENRVSNEQETGGLLSKYVNQALGANNPEMQTVQTRIDMAAESLRGILEQNGIEVISHEELSKTTPYTAKQIKWLSYLDKDLGADGFRIMDYSNSKRNRTICQQTGAKSTIFAEFKFEKEKKNVGLVGHEVAARVTMLVYVADSNGKKVLKKKYSGVSAQTTPYKNGNWDKQTVVDMFPDLIESVIHQFVFDYTTGNMESSIEDGNQENVQSTSLAIPENFTSKTEQADGSSTETGYEAE